MYLNSHLNSFQEYVDFVFRELNEHSISNLKKLPKNDLIMYHHGWGTDIRNGLGLWAENHPLTKDGQHPDDVSMEIMEGVWDKIHGK